MHGASREDSRQPVNANGHGGRVCKIEQRLSTPKPSYSLASETYPKSCNSKTRFSVSCKNVLGVGPRASAARPAEGRKQRPRRRPIWLRDVQGQSWPIGFADLCELRFHDPAFPLLEGQRGRMAQTYGPISNVGFLDPLGMPASPKPCYVSAVMAVMARVLGECPVSALSALASRHVAHVEKRSCRLKLSKQAEARVVSSLAGSEI